MEVIIVSASDFHCPYCDMAAAALAERGIPFRTLKLSTRDLVARFGKNVTVPRIYIDRQFIGGYSELQRFLREAFPANHARCRKCMLKHDDEEEEDAEDEEGCTGGRDSHCKNASINKGFIRTRAESPPRIATCPCFVFSKKKRCVGIFWGKRKVTSCTNQN